jgi:hypothetical protein
LKNKLVLSIALIIIFFGCDFIPRRKNINPDTLVTSLRRDDLFRSFDGYGVTTRDEASNIYFVRGEKEFGITQMIEYSPKATKYIHFQETSDSINYLGSEDSLEILNKSYELITILKELNLRWASGELGQFACSFNDSTKLIYVENRENLDSSFYEFRDSLRWIDNNFAVYY